MWYDFLRSYPIRFQRQKAISGFVADFYCHKARLIIEIDGSQHYEKNGKIYDDKRTAALEEFGLKVLRFSNADVDRNFYGVCECIERIVRERINEA